MSDQPSVSDRETSTGRDDGLLERLATARTIEISTTGHRSGRPVRTEIWWFRVEGRFVITGIPGARDWLANLRADPRLVVHALGEDYPATAQAVTDRDFRRRFFGQDDTEVAWYRSQADLEDLVDHAPMIEVHLHPAGLATPGVERTAEDQTRDSGGPFP